MSVTVTLDDRAVLGLLKKLEARAGNLTTPFAQIAADLEETARDSFAQGRDPWGGAWEPLSFRTKIKRLGGEKAVFKKNGWLKVGAIRAAAKGFQPLLDTGRLRASVKSAFGRDFAELSAGTNVKYAAIHQFGGRAGRGGKVTIPARPYLPIRNGRADLPPAQLKRIVGILQSALLDGLT